MAADGNPDPGQRVPILPDTDPKLLPNQCAIIGGLRAFNQLDQALKTGTDRQSVIFYGSAGTGKTRTARLLLYELEQSGLVGIVSGTLDGKLDAPWLLIDALERIHFTRRTSDLFAEIIGARVQYKLPTVITTQITPAQLAERLRCPDPQAVVETIKASTIAKVDFNQPCRDCQWLRSLGIVFERCGHAKLADIESERGQQAVIDWVLAQANAVISAQRTDTPTP
ncbi:MAG TPA: hypothetical protein VLT36_21725 [Candidatus Dormibacteraeota bacterium]|nr:hypothetical protein [Candidatus Dormibacteraeota bacterium]